MAMIKSIFEMPTRPCWVDGRRAIFHRWTDSARPVKPRGMEEDEAADRYQLHSVHALVEYEDGTVERVWPNAVRFADSEVYFLDYDWEDMERERDQNRHTCVTCAHGTDNVDVCTKISCADCAVECWCKDCCDHDKWEPKGGANG